METDGIIRCIGLLAIINFTETIFTEAIIYTAINVKRAVL